VHELAYLATVCGTVFGGEEDGGKKSNILKNLISVFKKKLY
jgi:hypothetical protein